MMETNTSVYPDALVDIVITVYNSEQYIGQAIESVLSQSINFKVNIHVYDDCSTDNTVNVISDHVQKNNNVFLHSSNHNLGTFGTLQKALSNCRSAFVAILEGDDYWYDMLKLQNQIDNLIANPNFAGCAGNSLVYNQKEGLFTGSYNPDLKSEYALEALFSVPPFQLSTLVFRRELLPTLPDSFRDTISNDKVVYTLLAKHGKIFCINKPLTVYRKHVASISNSANSGFIYTKHKLLYSVMKKHFGPTWHKHINEGLHDHLKGYMLDLINTKKKLKPVFFEYFYQWIRLNKWLSIDGYKEMYRFGRKIF